MGGPSCQISYKTGNEKTHKSRFDKMWENGFAEGEEPEPEFKEKLIEGFKQCYQISRKVPQSIIDSHGPMGKQFGRQKIFYKCTMKMEKELCVKKELLSWITYMYGTPNVNLNKKMGLPTDVYDAALMTFNVMKMAEEPTKKFVNKFMYGM